MSIAPLSVIALAVPAAAGAAFFLLKCGCWSRCDGSRDSQGCRHHGCFSRAAKCLSDGLAVAGARIRGAPA